MEKQILRFFKNILILEKQNLRKFYSKHVVFDKIVDLEVKPLESVESDAGNNEDLQKTTKEEKNDDNPQDKDLNKISLHNEFGDISKWVNIRRDL